MLIIDTMSESSFRILGIYNEKTFQLSENLGVHQMGFDFRPKSFNFFQGHCLIELLNRKNRPHYKYFLHYAHERDFVIHKMLADIDEYTDVPRDQLTLVFSDNQGLDFYEQFNLPFAWHFESLKSLKGPLESPLFTEISLSYSEIEFLHGQGHAILLLNEIKQLCSVHSHLTLSLRLPWELDMAASIFDFFHFDHYLLSISSQVEKSYRLVDSDKFTRHVHQIQGQLANMGL